MGIQDTLARAFRQDATWTGLIVLVTVGVLLVNIWGLFHHITTVLPHLFYLPIILAAYRFPKKGVVFSLGIGILYPLMVFGIAGNDPGLLADAIGRSCVFVIIGMVVAFLSLNLQDQQERYKSLFDRSEAGTFLLHQEGPDAVIDEANFRAAEILGTKTRNLAGAAFSSYWDNPEQLKEFYREIHAKGSCYSREYRLKRKSGGTVDVILSAGKVPGGRVIVTVVDITDRKRADEALRRANRELNLLSRVLQSDLLSATDGLSEVITAGKEVCRTPETAGVLARAGEAVRYLRRRIELAKSYQDLGSEPPVWIPVQETIRAQASRASVGTVSLRVWVERLEIYADHLAKDVFCHLLDNAVRHGGHTMDIVVTYHIVDDGVDLIFEDNGTGIADGEKDAVFQYGSEGHAGLGLFVGREILGVTGISIKETGRFGHGARFEIHVPRDAYRVV